MRTAEVKIQIITRYPGIKNEESLRNAGARKAKKGRKEEESIGFPFELKIRGKLISPHESE